MMIASRKIATFISSARIVASSFSSMATDMKISPLLQAKDAVNLFRKPNVVFVDASFHMDQSRDPEKEFLTERIPGAVRFCINSVCDKTSRLPHMIPSVEDFNLAMDERSISNDTTVILYGAKNALAGPRVWWTFKVFGHNNVAIIDGGLEEWKAAGGAVESGPVTASADESSRPGTTYQGVKNSSHVANSDDVVTAMKTGSAQIADARSMARFLGEVDEPRAGLRRGAIPGSLCIPFTSIVDPDNYTKFRSLKEMHQVFKDNGIIYGSKTILTCGSGVTASTLHFGLHLMGMDLDRIPVYDGSWTEWGDVTRNDLPVMGPEA